MHLLEYQRKQQLHQRLPKKEQHNIRNVPNEIRPPILRHNHLPKKNTRKNILDPIKNILSKRNQIPQKILKFDYLNEEFRDPFL